MNALDKIKSELLDLGYEPDLVSVDGFGSGKIAIIKYNVSIGRYKDKTFRVGISFQEDGYPEYPPHFVHIEELSNPRLPIHSQHSHGGANWSVFSAPPNDFWDRLPSSQKNMNTYMSRHMLRFWNQI